MLATRFTELVGCSVPIQLAGMGPVANPRLAAAVTNAGGLGQVSVGARNSRFAAPSPNCANSKPNAKSAWNWT